MKIVSLLVAAFLIWWILRTLRGRKAAAPKSRIKNMLACEYCGLHIPEDEAVRKDGHTYCSKEHARQDSR
ncbi:PP0621 family protein [Thiolapillus sp.]